MTSLSKHFMATDVSATGWKVYLMFCTLSVYCMLQIGFKLYYFILIELLRERDLVYQVIKTNLKKIRVKIIRTPVFNTLAPSLTWIKTLSLV